MAEQAGKFLTELPELETPTDGDLMYIVDAEASANSASKKITMSNLKRVLGGNVTGTVEDASVSFSDGADGIPMEECEVTLVPTQDLHGYSKPWAGGAGANMLHNTIWTETPYGIEVDTPSSGSYNIALYNDTLALGDYTIKDFVEGSNTTHQILVLKNGSVIKYLTEGSYTFTVDNASDSYIVRLYTYPSNTDTICKPIMVSGSSINAYEPYSNICPISGHTDVTVTVASTSGGSGEDTTVALGRTVYGGTLDVTRGALTVTHACVDLGDYNWTSEDSVLSGLARISEPEVRTLGAIYNQTPICSQYEGKSPKGYSQFVNGEIAFSNSAEHPLLRMRDENTSGMTDAQIKTYLTGVTFCYELATPQTFNLTPTQVLTLLGQNYVSHDGGGNIKVVYIRDLDITINDLIDRVTALENE